MNEDLPTTWAELSGSEFLMTLELTDGFHDAGFFDHKISGDYLDVTIHPIYFGRGYEYSYHGLNACKFRLSTVQAVSETSLRRASEEFTIMKLKINYSSLIFSFSTYELNVAVEMKECQFRFLAIANGEDYWSQAY